MDRLPSLNGLLVWGATFCLVTRGMVPPAATAAEAHDLATTSCLAGAGSCLAGAGSCLAGAGSCLAWAGSCLAGAGSCLAWTAWARAGLRRARAWAGRWR
jgi:hypothetical protein